MSVEQMPVIVLRGSPVERGRQHGAQLRSLIIDAFGSLRRRTSAQSWVAAKIQAAACLEYLSAAAPHLHEELQGVAGATDLDPGDILLLSAFEFFGDTPSGCTSAGFARADGAVVAQNWDASAGTAPTLAVLVHEGPDRHLVTVASPGTFGWVGMNGEGLAFVNNDLILDRSSGGLPSLIIRRLMLDQVSVEGAMTVLRIHRHMSGRCFVIGDASGGLRVVELGPSAGVTDRAVRSIVHTNHPLFSKPAMWENIEEGAQVYPSSRARLRAARSFPLARIDDVKMLLRDRTGAPDAICKSPSHREPTGTAFSVIFDCKRREALVALGRPDQSEYRRISILQMASA